MWTEKTNASEPPMRCRKRRNVTETRLQSLAWDDVEAKPVYGLDGDRHKGGVISVQALAWNVGTCRHDAKGKAQGAAPRGSNPDAWHRDGSTRSSVEAS
jgi:hypothetical protein